MNTRPRQLWTCAAIALLLMGCGSRPVTKIEDVVQDIKFKNRTRGEKQLADAATAAHDLGCSARSGALVRVDSHEVLPARPVPGRDVNQRLVISACGVGDNAVGTLTRRVSFQGRTLFEDSERYTLKPGRWMIDVFIGVPPQAAPGPYHIDVKFDRRGASFSSTDNFTVVAR